MKAFRSVSALVAMFLTLLGLAATPMVMSAQNATPSAEVAHPAHIHTGSCTELGDVVYPLNDVALAPGGGTPTASPTMMETMHDVISSITVVDASLDDLIAGGYAINVHASADDMGTYIACGDIAGTVRMHMRSEAPAGLVIPMRQLNESGYAGMAWLTPTADGKTEVSVFLASDFYGPGPQGGQ